MLRRLVISVTVLLLTATATPIPGFSPRDLVHDSELIVIGRITYLSTIDRAVLLNGRSEPGKEYFARIGVDSVLKAKGEVPQELNLHWIVPTPAGGSAAYSSPADSGYMILFLKTDEHAGSYTFASPYYPGVRASPSASLHNLNSDPPNDSEETTTHKVVEQMCRVAESADEDSQVRRSELFLLYSLKDQSVHDTAAALVHDPDPKLRDTALFAVLRAKDASFLPMAREEVIIAAKSPERSEGANNLMLAITQEFPANLSLPIIAEAANATNAELRSTAAYAARSTRSLAAIPILLPLVDDRDGEVAWNAMHSLGELTQHLDWRPTSREPGEWQRCLNLWHNFVLPEHTER